MLTYLRKYKKFHAMMCLILSILVFIGGNLAACAQDNMTPDYEVKFLLDSSTVLNSDKLLKNTYRSLFKTGSNYQTVGVLYLETGNRDFSHEGWINRIRIKEGASKFELAFKKRHMITDSDIKAGLMFADQEGFDISDTRYSAEVDWGYSKKTLSITCERTKSNDGYDELELPKRSKAIKIIKNKMPAEELNWLYDNWGTDTIEYAQTVGPVYYHKYTGIYNEYKVVIEIWPIEDQTTEDMTYITELSFKAGTYDEASELRSSLLEFLDDLEILIHDDSLKTQLIMDAYLGS